MKHMMYKENNVNCLYKILITANFNYKSMRFIFKSVKNKEVVCPNPYVTN